MRELHNEGATDEWMLSGRKNRHRNGDQGLFQKEAKLLAVLEGDASLRPRKIMQPSAKELPRLSGALRAFGGLTSEVNYVPVSIDETFVRKKQKTKNASSSTEKNWSEVSEEVTALCNKQDTSKVIRHWCALIRNTLLICAFISFLRSVQN